MAMIENGLHPSRCGNHHDPRLLTALEAGVTPEDLGALVREVPGKGLAWYCATAVGRKQDAATLGQGRGSMPGAPPPKPPVDPLVAWKRERDHELENKLIAIRHKRDKLGSLTPEEAAEQEAEARRVHDELIARGPEDQAA